jgi:hypothetical protein
LLAAWFGWGAIEMNYVYGVRIPHPETGLTIPHQTKGITVYISEANQELQRWLVYVMIGSGIIIFIYLVISGEWRRKLNGQPPQSN